MVMISELKIQGISLIVIKSFASQLLQTLRFLRKLHVIHCDLKPENILLQHPTMSKIKVIDFGSSCFSYERGFCANQSHVSHVRYLFPVMESRVVLCYSNPVLRVILKVCDSALSMCARSLYIHTEPLLPVTRGYSR